jgi:hypothetical protein
VSVFLTVARSLILRTERAVDTLGSDMLLLGVISGAIMSADMGTLRVDVEIENPANSGEKRTISSGRLKE